MQDGQKLYRNWLIKTPFREYSIYSLKQYELKINGLH